jgi:hypothetical protein
LYSDEGSMLLSLFLAILRIFCGKYLAMLWSLFGRTIAVFWVKNAYFSFFNSPMSVKKAQIGIRTFKKLPQLTSHPNLKISNKAIRYLVDIST